MTFAVIGQKTDLQGYTGKGEMLDDWMEGLYGNTNWSWQRNRDFIVNHVKHRHSFELLTPLWDLDDQALQLQRNNTIGVEILALARAGYQFEILSVSGGSLSPPKDPDMDALVLILDDANIPQHMPNFWKKYREELRAIYKTE